MLLDKRLLCFVVLMALFPVDRSYSQDQLRPADIEFGKRWLQQVQRKNSNEDLMTAALVAQADDPALAAQLLDKATSEAPPDKLLLSAAVYHCFADGPSGLCEGNALFEQLIKLDPDNLEPYLYYMVRLLDQGDESRALDILRQGIDVPRHNDYFYDKARLIRNTFIAEGFPAVEAHLPAMGYANAVAYYAFYSKIHAACPKLSMENAEWKQACLFLGARMGNSSKAFMGNVFGNAIVRDVLVAVNADPDVIQLFSERREWDNKVREVAGEKLEWWSDPSQYPQEFIEDQMNIPERESVMRALLRTQ